MDSAKGEVVKAWVVLRPDHATTTQQALRALKGDLTLKSQASGLPFVEVHLSDLTQREPWRRVSVIAEVAAHRITGKGIAGYLEALEWLVAHPR